MVWIPGGTFAMGSDRHYREERPVRTVAVDGFWIDTHQVTNRQFTDFTSSTGYVTVAERRPDTAMYPGAPPENLVPGSMVFVPTRVPVDLGNNAQWWRWVPGAQWRQPYGPVSSEHIPDHPVVHVAWEDIEAYAAWIGGTIPTEAEWEFAARGGLDGAEFTWGDEDTQNSRPMANTWQGQFPWRNTRPKRENRTLPVGSFPPNGYGLYDMAGNVWEWTADWYQDSHEPDSGCACCVPQNPRGGTLEGSMESTIRIPRKVVKGGSHLCARDACFRYRPAARQPQMIDTGMSHVGFRCIQRPPADLPQPPQ
jgi:formylglycine-generating enzyme required for sulfatase activity